MFFSILGWSVRVGPFGSSGTALRGARQPITFSPAVDVSIPQRRATAARCGSRASSVGNLEVLEVCREIGWTRKLSGFDPRWF